MTQSELMALGRLEGRVGALETQVGRVEEKLDDLAERMDRDRESIVEFRIEDLTRQIDAAKKVRASMRPPPSQSRQRAITGLLVSLAAIASWLATWLAT